MKRLYYFETDPNKDSDDEESSNNSSQLSETINRDDINKPDEES